MNMCRCLLAAISILITALPAKALDGTGRKYLVVDAWEGTSEPDPGQSRSLRLGKDLSIKVANLDGWIMREVAAKRMDLGNRFTADQVKEIEARLKAIDLGTSPPELSDATRTAVASATLYLLDRLYPVIGGIELPRATRRGYDPATFSNEDTFHILRFTIDRKSKGAEAESGEAWARLLKTSRRTIRPTVTLAYKIPPE